MNTALLIVGVVADVLMMVGVWLAFCKFNLTCELKKDQNKAEEAVILIKTIEKIANEEGLDPDKAIRLKSLVRANRRINLTRLHKRRPEWPMARMAVEILELEEDEGS